MSTRVACCIAVLEQIIHRSCFSTMMKIYKCALRKKMKIILLKRHTLLHYCSQFVDKGILTCKRIKTKNRWSPIYSVVRMLCSKIHSCEN